MIEVIRVVELQNHRKSIEIVCPKCGKTGRLRLISPKTPLGRPRFKVVHGREYRQSVCCFGNGSEEYDELKELYFREKGQEVVG